MPATASALKQQVDEFTPRQQDVLTAALDLLVESGDALTMTEVARRANCSKETLYKWFGDRNGLLTATVQWQAAKVRMPAVGARLDATQLRSAIEQFARDLLSVLTGDISVALNRLAVTHAGPDKANLGTVLLEHGPLAIRRRLKPVLEAGRTAGFLQFDDSETAYRSFFGLVVRDVQIRLLLGDETLKAIDVDAEAKAATAQFFSIYGAA